MLSHGKLQMADYLHFLPHFIGAQVAIALLFYLWSRSSAKRQTKKQIQHLTRCLDYLPKMLDHMNEVVGQLEAEYDARRLFASNGTWERLNELRGYRDGIKYRLSDLDYQAERLGAEEIREAFSTLLAAPLNTRLKSNERIISSFPLPTLTIDQTEVRFAALAEEIAEMLKKCVKQEKKRKVK